jgi:hypothetical protein
MLSRRARVGEGTHGPHALGQVRRERDVLRFERYELQRLIGLHGRHAERDPTIRQPSVRQHERAQSVKLGLALQPTAMAAWQHLMRGEARRRGPF